MKKKNKKESGAYSVEGAEVVLPEEGVHLARVIGFIEMGTQEGEFGEKFKVQIRYELVELSHVFNEEKGEQNFVVRRNYNRSLHKRADLGKDVRAILGKDFPEKGELEMLLLEDRPCQVEIQHSEDGKYANVVKVMAPPKGLKVPKSENEFISLFLDDSFDEDVFDNLSDGMREKIEESPEYQKMFGKGPKRKKSRDEDDDEDDQPRRKKGRKDEDDDEDEDEKPRRKARKSSDDDEEEEEDEDESPRRKKAPAKKGKRRK